MPGTRSPGVSPHLRVPFHTPCHREGGARGDPLGAGKQTALSERVDCMQWIAASFTSFFPRDDRFTECSKPNILSLKEEGGCNRMSGDFVSDGCEKLFYD
ncbi:MAG: hypothetical protein ACJZ72_04770 [Opitutales bacterium]